MSEAEVTALTERQRYWLEQVQACEASGKTIAEHAAEHSLAAQAMYAGKKILVRKGVLPPTRPARFQRAWVAGPVVGSEWRIHLPNGVSVAFSGTVDAATLTTVLNTAATLR
ncbi:MAG: hypothetical protein BMS9Abin08_0469 [Gammaproteobacteria bacterium]|nr:MAG: hypothetical protein BMS9Abin08_0469 [Gammaproteobacteria bacterium]